MLALSAAGAAAATLGYWSIARDAARRRAIPIGSLPPALLALAALSAAIAAMRGNGNAAAIVALAGACVAGLIDARTGLIFNPLPAAIFAAAAVGSIVDRAPIGAAVGGLSTGGALLTIYALTRGRGLGLGDVKLAAALGAGLGCPAGLVAFGCAFVFGALYGTWLLATGRAARNQQVRFGPFIAAGTLVAVVAPGTLA
jgi:leader peptidase (prepilin peptidase) / N-methyltransferase